METSRGGTSPPLSPALCLRSSPASLSPFLEEFPQVDRDRPWGLSFTSPQGPCSGRRGWRGQLARRLRVPGPVASLPGSCVQQGPGSIVRQIPQRNLQALPSTCCCCEFFFLLRKMHSEWDLPENGCNVPFLLFMKKGKATKYRSSIRRTLGL